MRLAYNRIAAHTAPCGPWPDQVADTGENRHYAAFGCATQQNLAAMVASPLDLIYPRGLTPADAQRRATVLDTTARARRSAPTYCARPAAPSQRELANERPSPSGSRARAAGRAGARPPRRRRPAGSTHLGAGVLQIAGCRGLHRIGRRRSPHGPRPRQGSHRRPERRRRVLSGGSDAQPDHRRNRSRRATAWKPTSTVSPRSATPAPKSW